MQRSRSVWIIPLLVSGLAVSACQKENKRESGSGNGTGRHRKVAASTASALPSEGDAQRASKLFADTCAACHGNKRQGGIGPSLIDVGSRYSEAKIAKIAQFGKGRKKDVSMPAGLVSADDASLLARWLATEPNTDAPGPGGKLGSAVSGIIGNSQ